MDTNKVTITLGSVASVSGLNKKQIDEIKAMFSISNPLFWKKQSMELSTWGLDQTLKYYTIQNKDTIDVPMGQWEKIKPIIGDDYKLKDERVTYSHTNPLNTSFNGALYDYQQKMVDEMQNHDRGVIEAITGAGKTICFINHTVQSREPTLILVNTIDLAKQIVESFTKFTDLKKSDIGFVGNGKFELKKVTVGTHQTLARLDDPGFAKLNKHFGQVIADEVHIIAAETFFNNMQKLKAKYKYGFSSTPSRGDGLTAVIHYACGDKIYKVPEEEVKDYIVTPSYQQIATDYNFDLFDTQEYQIMLNYQALDEKRNRQIADYIINEIPDDKAICVLCRRTDQIDALYEMLTSSKLKSGDIDHLTSRRKKADREVILEQLKTGKKRIIISTYGLMSTGIDVPAFEYLIFAAPISSKNQIRQAAGRLMRRFKGKTQAFIVDFVDFNIGLLAAQANKRKKILDNLINSIK